MKTLLLLLCLTIGYTGFSQSKNKQKIAELNTEIEEAIENQDFEKASVLKKEKDIRTQIEEAIKNGDFDKAELLKNNLSKSQNLEQMEDDSENVQLVGVNDKIEVESYQRHKSIKRGFYMDLTIGGGFVSTVNGGGWGGAFGFDIGTRFGKYEYGKRYRLMFDIEWANLSVLAGNNLYFSYYENNNNYSDYGPSIGACLFKPGVAFSYAINSNIGIETSLHFGAHLEFMPVGEYANFGLAIDPRFIFRIKNFGVGLKFLYTPFFELGSNAFGNAFRITPTIGVKF